MLPFQNKLKKNNFLGFYLLKGSRTKNYKLKIFKFLFSKTLHTDRSTSKKTIIYTSAGFKLITKLKKFGQF